MNKRQFKKKVKKIAERIEHFDKHPLHLIETNRDILYHCKILKVCFDKKYKPFKELKKKYKNIVISTDWGNGEDYTVQTTMKINGDIKEVLAIRVIK